MGFSVFLVVVKKKTDEEQEFHSKWLIYLRKNLKIFSLIGVIDVIFVGFTILKGGEEIERQYPSTQYA